MTLSSYDLNSGGGGGGSINENTAIVSGPGSAFAVHMLFQGFPSGDGWGHPLCHFFLQTVRAQVFLICFH